MISFEFESLGNFLRTSGLMFNILLICIENGFFFKLFFSVKCLLKDCCLF